MSERVGGSLLIVLLVVVGAFAWTLRLRPSLRVDAAPLASLPHELGAWRGVDVPLESSVESMLRADFNLQRAYVHPFGDTVWLYIGYYGTARGGTPEHTPAACYRAHGWRIEEEQRLVIAPERKLRVNEYLVEKDGQRELVHFWFRSHRTTGVLGLPDRMLDHLLGRVLEGRADGSLVRVSGAVEGDLPAVRSRLIEFAIRLDRTLDAHWPNEVQVSRRPARAGRAGTEFGALELPAPRGWSR